MNPFEVERLGWEQIRGLPVMADAEIGTGRFRIGLSRDLDDGGIEEIEAVEEKSSRRLRRSATRPGSRS